MNRFSDFFLLLLTVVFIQIQPTWSHRQTNGIDYDEAIKREETDGGDMTFETCKAKQLEATQKRDEVFKKTALEYEKISIQAERIKKDAEKVFLKSMKKANAERQSAYNSANEKKTKAEAEIQQGTQSVASLEERRRTLKNLYEDHKEYVDEKFKEAKKSAKSYMKKANKSCRRALRKAAKARDDARSEAEQICQSVVEKCNKLLPKN